MNKNSILVVEDDRPIRNLIITALKTHDYKYLQRMVPLPFWRPPHIIRILFCLTWACRI